MNEKANHIFKLEDYPNHLDYLRLTSSVIREQISDIHLTFSSTRNNQVEWGIRFPMFVYPFYRFIYKHNRIPKQEEFYQFYIDENKSFFDEGAYSSEIMEGLKARVYRTYPSLVRDIYFNKYVQEHIMGFRTIYNLKLDIEEGIDLMLTNGNVHYGVCLYTNTFRAYVGRNAKQNRHRLFENVRYIEFPMDFKGNLKIVLFSCMAKKNIMNF